MIFKGTKICEETFDEETEKLTTRETETKIFDGEEEVGYLQLLESYDEDGDYEWLYVGTIEIHEAFRNQWRGTKVLRQLAEKYGTDVHNVNAWISKVRKKLYAEPEFMAAIS